MGDTLADTRFYSLGHFNALLFGVSGPDPSIVWGNFEFQWEIEFRSPVDADAEALRARVPDQSYVLETIKSNRAKFQLPEDKDDVKTNKDYLVVNQSLFPHAVPIPPLKRK